MNKRGAYFFVVDALIAGAVIVSTLIFLFGTVNIAPDSNPTLRSMNEYVNFLSSTKIREYPGTYVSGLIDDNNITNLDNTMIDQVVEWYYFNDSNPIIGSFLSNVSKGAVSNDRSVNLFLNNTIVYNRTLMTQDKATLLLSTKRIVFKRINDTLILGPMVMEVKIWA